MTCQHDREIDWLTPPKPRQRRPRFRVYCTKCGAESGHYRLSGHDIDADGLPIDLAQASDDVLDQAPEILP